MNSTPPTLPSSPRATAGYAKRDSWLALGVLAIGIAPARVCLFLIYTTHYKSSSVDAVLGKFFIADTACALISGVGIGPRVIGISALPTCGCNWRPERQFSADCWAVTRRWKWPNEWSAT